MLHDSQYTMRLSGSVSKPQISQRSLTSGASSERNKDRAGGVGGRGGISASLKSKECCDFKGLNSYFDAGSISYLNPA